MRARISLFLAVLLGLLSLCGSVWAVEVFEPGYLVETYVTYSGTGIGSAIHMVFDSDANLYITHLGTSRDVRDGLIYKIGTDRQVWVLAEGFYYPRDIIWTGGSAYGNYLYVADTGRAPGGEIDRVDLNGNISRFSVPNNQPGCVALDITGNYGGYLYSGTLGRDHIDLINLTGGISRFSNFPYNIGGGPYDMAFDPGVAYSGLMYVATTNYEGIQYSGIFCLDTNGAASRFTNDLVSARYLAFDQTGDFEGDLFAIGQGEVGGDLVIWSVDPDGTAAEFAVGTVSSPSGLVFGPDGAMYVAEYSAEDETVIISRIQLSRRQVAVDVKPGSCPNPLNLATRGVLPVAILGVEDFDVSTIDQTSIRLDGVAALRHSFEDVAAPVVDGDECECSTDDPDGYADLTLKFRTQEIVEKLINTPGGLVEGQTLVLTLTGELFDGTAIEGTDCVVLVGNVLRYLLVKGSDINGDGIVSFLDFAMMTEYWLESW